MFNVIVTLQSPGNAAVEFNYANGVDSLGAIVAAGQALRDHADDATGLPASVRPVVTHVEIVLV